MIEVERRGTERIGALLQATTPRLFRRLPPSLDLRDEVQLESLLQTADGLLDRVERAEDLLALESIFESAKGDWPLTARIAVKLARSKLALASRTSPLHLSVVLPVYAENERMLRPSEHALGEGFLDRKLRQLDWLLDSESSHSSSLWVVDDGCPDGSGHRAEQVFVQRHPNAEARVLYLQEALDQGHPVVEGIRSTRESQKGGAVQLGLYEAARAERSGADHFVFYTDADLSTHLGQAGLLVSALEPSGMRVAAGSRRAQNSVVVKSAGRSARGRLFIYLWKKLLPELAYVDDTQCGFKAMRAEQVASLVDAPSERGFAFDLEILLRAELSAQRSVAQVPIAWIDSDAASSTTARSPYLGMLRSAVRLSRRAGKRRGMSEAFAAAIEGLDEAAWQSAIDRLGPILEAIDPALDRDHLPIAPAQLVA